MLGISEVYTLSEFEFIVCGENLETKLALMKKLKKQSRRDSEQEQ